MKLRTTHLMTATGISIAALLTFAPRSTPAAFAETSVARSATTAFVSAPPKSGRRMHWIHARTTARESRFGSTVVVGLGSMRDLASLETTYGFEHVQAVPSLRAAKVRIGAR